MKALVLTLVLLAILSTQLPRPVAAASDCTYSTCRVIDARSVTTNNWGTSFVSDSITVSSGSSSVSHITVGIPSSLSGNFRFATAGDGSNQLRISPLTPAPSGGSYSVLDVGFPSLVSGAYQFNLTSVYTDMLSFNATNFAFRFAPFPLTDGSYNVTDAKLTVKTGDWSSPRISGINATFTSATFVAETFTLKPVNTTVATITFSQGSTVQQILAVSADRTITLAQNGAVQVTDFYNVTNRSHDLSSLTIPVPNNVQTVKAYDVLGLVSTLTTTKASDGTNIVSFIPRFGTIKAGAGSSVTLSYPLPTQSYLTSKGLGQYELSFHLLENVKFFQQTMQTTIVVPFGFRLESLSGQTFTSSGNRILVQVSTVNPLSNLSFTMDYQLDPFWASLSAIGWAGLAAVSLAAVVLAAGATGVAGVAVSGAPAELIGRFVELYDEKSAMRLEAEKMDEDLSRGALNRHEFKRRRRVIDLRMAEIDRTLAPVKDQLGKENARYQDMIKRLERAEADIQVVRTTTSDLKNQYRSGRIARELYESLVSDLVRRKEKAQQTMDTIVINLREETR